MPRYPVYEQITRRIAAGLRTGIRKSPPVGGTVGSVPALSAVGSSGSLASRTGGSLSGITLTNQRFTTQVSFGSGDVTLTNCEFAGGLATTYPGHGRITMNYCTNPASSGSGWWFEESPTGWGNPGGSDNVELDHCLFYGGSNGGDGTMQAIRPKGAGMLRATDCWFLSYGQPPSGTHTETIQSMYGAQGIYTRCAFSRQPVTNNTVSGVFWFENPADGATSEFYDCEVGYYNGTSWSRGGGFYMVAPCQSKWYRPVVHTGIPGNPEGAWFLGNPPIVLVNPVYL